MEPIGFKLDHRSGKLSTLHFFCIQLLGFHTGLGNINEPQYLIGEFVTDCVSAFYCQPVAQHSGNCVAQHSGTYVAHHSGNYVAQHSGTYVAPNSGNYVAPYSRHYVAPYSRNYVAALSGNSVPHIVKIMWPNIVETAGNPVVNSLQMIATSLSTARQTQPAWPDLVSKGLHQ